MLSYHGHRIDLAMIKDMVEGQLETYQTHLRRTFFFGEEIPADLLPDFDITKLVDDTQNRSTGYTFLEDPRNGLAKFKESYGKWLLSDDKRRSRFTYHNGTGIFWKPQWAIEFIAAFEALELDLAPGLIFSAGPSARTTEFGRQLLREMPGARRNLGMVLQNVSLNATTDKTSHQRMLDRFVPHIPTREWAYVLLRHLAIFRPFIDYLVRQIYQDDEAVDLRYSFYLWPGISGTMKNQRLKEKLCQITLKYLGQGHGLKFWRNLTTTVLQFGVDEQVNETNRQYYYDVANMHTTSTSVAKYGGNTSNLIGVDSRVTAGCIRVGQNWHKRIGLSSQTIQSLTVSTSPIATISQSSASVIEEIKAFRDQSISAIKASVSEIMAEFSLLYFPPPPRPRTWLPVISNVEVHPSRLVAFRKFMNDPDAHWSCPEQAIFVESIVRGRENVLGVLATGFGKTTTVMFIASAFSPGKSTVVIMPLAALHEDFHERARQYGLKACRWRMDGKFDGFSNIITAAIEDLMQDKFIE